MRTFLLAPRFYRPCSSLTSTQLTTQDRCRGRYYCADPALGSATGIAPSTILDGAKNSSFPR